MWFLPQIVNQILFIWNTRKINETLSDQFWTKSEEVVLKQGHCVVASVSLTTFPCLKNSCFKILQETLLLETPFKSQSCIMKEGREFELHILKMHTLYLVSLIFSLHFSVSSRLAFINNGFSLIYIQIRCAYLKSTNSVGFHLFCDLPWEWSFKDWFLFPRLSLPPREYML